MPELTSMQEAKQEAGRARSKDGADGSNPALAGPQTGPAMLAHDDSDVYALPATQGQIRFWSLDQLNPGNPALNMPLMWKCTGPLRVEVLEQAFTECIRRHEALRTTFALLEGKLAQIAHPPYPATIALVDLSGWRDEAARRQEAERVTREHAAYRFDLKRGPLLVLKLIRFSQNEHLLLVTMHHIICDGISLGILLRDMAVFYEALCTHKEADLPELPIQFADFAVWQEEWLRSPDAEQSLQFWRETLGADLERIHLPRDPDAAAALGEQRSHWTGDIETLLIPPDLQRRAHAFCKREGVTLNILLFSIFAALLHRLTGQFDLVIGSPCANRTEDTEELIGLFMNIQVMRLRLAADERFRSLLAKVERWTLGACDHQTLPFESVIHDSVYSEGSDSFELPIFFLYQKSFMITHRVAGVEIVPLRSESPGAVFEIFFAIVDRAEEGPRLQLEYNPRYFKQSTIQRYLRLYVHLLQSALEAPDASLVSLAAHPAAGRVTTSGGATAPTMPRPVRSLVGAGPSHAFQGERRHEVQTLTGLFLEACERHAERTAVTCGEQHITYRELRETSERIASGLVARGAGPGTIVAICLERSIPMIAAMLGVLRTGAAYLPLDPLYPQERLVETIADAGPVLVIGAADSVLALNKTAAKAVTIESLLTGELYAEPPAVELADNRPAYVIYTSGSTGKPKGVVVSHRNVVKLLANTQARFQFSETDVWTMFHSFAFDFSVWEIWGSLAHGGRLVLVPYAVSRAPDQFHALLLREEVTVLNQTPSAFVLLNTVDERAVEPLESLRLVIFGGEALPPALLTSWFARHPEDAPEMVNMYGITETTVHVTWRTMRTRDALEERESLIGEPIPGVQLYLLDEARQPVAAETEGELWVGGEGVAIGYLNRPELTAERFVVRPDGRRMYRSGDCARRRGDGELVYLGRRDGQVKINGFRIETGEIEAALLGCPGVQQACVLAIASPLAQTSPNASSALGETRLVACFVADRSVPAAQLSRRLAGRLPAHMLPVTYLQLPELPLNDNGKTDRRALTVLAESAVTKPGDGLATTAALVEQERYYPPQDVIERQLQDIWQTTLGLPRISVRASFFSLGAGSLTALRLITKMNRIFATDLGLASLISASSIESIAELIRTRFAPNRDSALVPLQPNGTRPPLFIAHGVGGNVVNFYGLARRVGTDQPIYGIQSQALIANQPALLHLQDMARHYIEEIRTLQPHGPYYLLGYSFGGTMVLEMAHQLRAAGEQVALIGMIDSKTRDYQESAEAVRSVQDRINHRLNRFRGNTGELDWGQRLRYVQEKVSTRAIRYACMLAVRLKLTQVPSFMRSAWDINLVAYKNYKLQPFDGRLVLFRASHQDQPDAPHDLGWSSIFLKGVEIHDLPGDHERIFLEPNIDKLAASLRECLTRV